MSNHDLCTSHLGNNDHNKNDKDLGMHCPITRRDFLNGVALTIGSTMIPPAALALDDAPAAPEKAAGYYPPALMGMRGNHDGTQRESRKARAKAMTWSSWVEASVAWPQRISIASKWKQKRRQTDKTRGRRAS